MSRAWFPLAAVAVVGAFCLAFGQEQPPSRRERANQEPALQPPEGRGARGVPRGQVGRYQMAIRDGAQSGSRPYVVVCDTTTGRCWVASLTPGGGQGWRDLGGPGERPTIGEAPQLAPPALERGDAAPRVPPPAVAPPADAIPTLPPIPRLPNDTPRALPPAGELPPPLPGQQLVPGVPT